MMARIGALLLAAWLVGACAPSYSTRVGLQAPSPGCGGQAARGQDGVPTRPMFLLFCAESP